MVEYQFQLDMIFQSLSDPIRRDILQRIKLHEMTIGELVDHYDVSFAAVSKHIKVLERARLITRRRAGRNCMVTLDQQALRQADDYLEQYRRMWQGRYDKLDAVLNEGGSYGRSNSNKRHQE